MLGLAGFDPVTCDTARIPVHILEIQDKQTLEWNQSRVVSFHYERDMVFHFSETLPFHPNGMTLVAETNRGEIYHETYYSIGGGFVVQEGESGGGTPFVSLPRPIHRASELLDFCQNENLTIPQVVWENERIWRSEAEIERELQAIWETMQACIWRGCYTEGILPGGLRVSRRAAQLHRKLIGEQHFPDVSTWKNAIINQVKSFQGILKWVSCFALAVNEENASFGRVVTAPTNGAAGVIPAVLMYYACFCDANERGIQDFLLTAGEMGSLFKKGATISAAMGGCQAEIGVSSAMAAAGLTQVLGGSPDQVLMAAEIAMEHHLGLTCDPIGGLVQIPCIERNTMGAMKAITAANIALESDPAMAKVPLDAVIRSMWETALDMNTKYKETSEGGLAVHIPVNVSEC